MVHLCCNGIVLLLLLATTPAFAWLDKGHRVVGFIAEANLSAEARRQIQEILLPDATLADAAVWPDHEGRSLRELDPLHYVSIPDRASRYDQARDCPKRNCMVEALKWFSTNVADKNAPLTARRIALRFVAHLVGDMHQPLHAGRAADSGGTEINVTYQRKKTNLHYFWDSDLVEMEGGTAMELAKRLGASVIDEDRRRWQEGTPESWTNESLKLARIYGYTIGANGQISDDYVKTARPVVRLRLLQASIRLAWLLNSTLK